MMPQAQQFPFLALNPTAGSVGLFPILPLQLAIGSQTVSVLGLLDSGALVNVLPHDLGLQLGADWDQQSTHVQLTGNLAQYEARGLVVTATVAALPPVHLVFAWTKSNIVPLLLGQMNFFLEFDVCFFRARGIFEVKPKS
jgi:hypothetical protein